jgi:hypothetical protein
LLSHPLNIVVAAIEEEFMTSYRRRAQLRVAATAEAASRKSDDPTRHKCFVSYHADDADEVEEFLENFGHVFIPRVIGVSDDDDFIDSSDTDYVMDCIRETYLTDSTVTMVMVGACTWARRYVDWEIYSSLRNDSRNRRSGLLAITLPSVADIAGRELPARVSDNGSGTDGDEGYARWWKYPSSADAVRSRIETAFEYRTSRAHLVENSRTRRTANTSC